jgi:hypothetical protein
MLLDARWLIPGRVYYLAPHGMLDAVTLSAVLERAQAIFPSFQSSVIHLILDFNNAQREESLIPQLKAALDAVRKLHPAPPLAGWTIIIDPAPNQIVKSIGASATQVIRLRTRYMSELAPALEFLYGVDETLSDD